MIQLKEFCGMCRSYSWCGRECRNAPGLDVMVAKAWPAATKKREGQANPKKSYEPITAREVEVHEEAAAKRLPVFGIATLEESKARTIAIASGKLKPKKGDPKVWITPETAMRKKRAEKKEATK